ncbi:hypothetical protein, partial [Burkholderia pseudomallei]
MRTQSDRSSGDAIKEGNGSVAAKPTSRTNSNETTFPAQAEEPRKQSLTAAPTPNPTTINLKWSSNFGHCSGIGCERFETRWRQSLR